LPGVILVALLMVVSAGAVVASLSGGESTSATPSLPGPTSSLSPSASPRTPNLPNFPSAFPSVGSALPSSAYSPSSLAPVGGAPLGKPASTLPFSVSNPQTAAFVQQVNHAIAAGTVPRYAAYLPNYNLYAHPISDPSQIVSPRYTTFPAPMGLGDFGLNGGGSYVNYTPSFDGQFTLSAYNATAGGLYEDTGAYYWDGLSPNQGVSPYQSGVQLNTVMTNVSIPGSTTAAFWTQNVIDFQQGQLTFVDNVWNFSALALNLGTIYSGNGSVVPGNFYYDLGPKIPLTFPIAVNLYNNASVVNGRTQVTFGYAIGESGHVYHGVYDTVVFNSISAPLPADFMVNGNTATQNPSSVRTAPDASRASRKSRTKARAGSGTAPFCEDCRDRSRNSLLTSRAVCNRWRGSFSRQRRTMRARSLGRSGRTSVTDGGVSRRIAETNSAEEFPSNGRRPVAISCSTMPREKMSVR